MTRPGMADGRCFTSYIPSGILNMQMQEQYKVDSGPRYRTFLQQNAESVKDAMRQLSIVQDTKLKESNAK